MPPAKALVAAKHELAEVRERLRRELSEREQQLGAVAHELRTPVTVIRGYNNLLLSDHAEVDTKPELEIYADDVKCSHGATTGSLDANSLFYLRSRGLDEETARGLLTFAFAEDVVDRLGLLPLRKMLEREVIEFLPQSKTIEAFV